MTQFYVDALGAYLGGFDGAEPPAGAIEVAEPPAHAADKWTGGVWQVAQTVPVSVPKLNARLVLINAGYWDDVVSFVSAQGPVAVAYLEDAQTMRRDNPLVNAWAAARGKSGELDGLFIAAGALNV